MSHVRCHVPRVTCHVSCVTCHVLHAMCRMSLFCLTNWWSLLVEGLFSTGNILSSFYIDKSWKYGSKQKIFGFQLNSTQFSFCFHQSPSIKLKFWLCLLETQVRMWIFLYGLECSNSWKIRHFKFLESPEFFFLLHDAECRKSEMIQNVRVL